MPIVVNPGFVWPPETEPVVSPDGRITAIVDPAHAGVLLQADFSDWGIEVAPSPQSGRWATSGGVEVNGNSFVFPDSKDAEAITDFFPVNESDEFDVGVTFDVEPDTLGVNVQYRIYSYDESRAYLGSTFLTSTQGLGGDGTYSGKVKPIAGTKYVRMRLYVTTQTGSDGTARVSGIRANRIYSADEHQPVAKVRFERQDGTLVRSGNPAWAPGGWAHAYDHEATLGGGTLWRAVPIHFDGTEGTPSEYVGAVIPALTDGWAWLKPVTDPDKAMLLKVEPPDLSYDGRVETTSITGSSKPAATWDVLEGFTTQLRSLVREKNVADQLMALLDEGPVLAQFPECAGLPDFYFIRGKVDLEHVHWDGYPWRRYQWEAISVHRPTPTDTPLRMPGLSYNTVERDWLNYDQLADTVDSYNQLLEP